MTRVKIEKEVGQICGVSVILKIECDKSPIEIQRAAIKLDAVEICVENSLKIME